MIKKSKIILFCIPILTIGCNFLENKIDSSEESNFAPSISALRDVSTIPSGTQTQPADTRCPAGKRRVHVANNQDQIIIEAEHAYQNGNFEFRDSNATNAVPGAKGSGYIIYKRSGDPADSNHNYDGQSQMAYFFTVSQSGLYTYDARGARASEGLDITVCGHHILNCAPGITTSSDLNNDEFNNFTSNNNFEKAYIYMGTSLDQWRTGPKFDIHGQSHFTGRIQLNAGTIYVFERRGRSNFFALDRFSFALDTPTDLHNDEFTDIVCL